MPIISDISEIAALSKVPEPTAEDHGQHREVDSFNVKIVSHLPDLVVQQTDQNKGVPYQIQVQGVLMFLDVSGFTALTEKYSLNSKNGTDQLTKTLNIYMNSLVSEIIDYDGDVMEFAGDAILTLWRVQDFISMKITVAHVIRCAMSIQKKCGKYETSVGVVLKVKIGISAGEVIITFLGTENFRHYASSGRAVESVNAAEHYCVSGDIIVSPSAWVHCSGLNVNVQVMDDNKHRKILMDDGPPEEGELDDMERISVGLPYKPMRTMEIKTSVMQDIMKNLQTKKDTAPPPPATTNEGTDQKDNQNVPSDPLIKVRKSIMMPQSSEMLSVMQLYLSPPVRRKVKDGQPLEYLNEMRQLTILFVNLVLQISNRFEMSYGLQQTFSVIFGTIREYKGLLNKLFMFDKGCTYLAIFGLPGFKYDNDCARALQCAYKLQQEVKKLSRVVEASVGVTTGSTYCGVMGHELRHEYTVIGRKVNMAARLMMAYQGKVVCDNETYHHSKLLKAHFSLVEIKKMKGLQNVGTIREYKETKGHIDTIDALKQQELEFPIIGRHDELMIIKDILHKMKDPQQYEKPYNIVCIKGDSGVGKSRLLDSMIVGCDKEQIRVVFSHIQSTDNQPFLAAKLLLMELMDFDVAQPHQERERVMYETFKDPFILQYLPLLNDLLYMKIKWQDSLVTLQSSMVEELQLKLLAKMVHEVTDRLGYIVFAIDDVQYMDKETWKFIDALSIDPRSLVLMTMKGTSRTNMPVTSWAILEKKSTLHLHIQGIEDRHVTALACQLLGVTALPKTLDKLLRDKSHGYPSWCEQLLYSMLYDGMLLISTLRTTTPEYEMAVPMRSVHSLSETTLKVPDKPKQLEIEELGDHRKDPPPKTAKEKAEEARKDLICVLAPGKNLTDVRIPDSIKGMIQAQIDRMDDVEQMLVKTAAILGKVFSRNMLIEVLPRKLATSEFDMRIASIVENGLFECGTVMLTLHLPSITSIKSPPKYHCNCPQADGSIGGLGVEGCRTFTFRSGTVQETAYEMYTESLRRKLHIRAAKFLESQAHRCEFCGGGNFSSTDNKHGSDHKIKGDGALGKFIEEKAAQQAQDAEEEEAQSMSRGTQSSNLAVPKKKNFLGGSKSSSTGLSPTGDKPTGSSGRMTRLRKASLMNESLLKESSRRSSTAGTGFDEMDIDDEDNGGSDVDPNLLKTTVADMKKNRTSISHRRSLALPSPKKNGVLLPGADGTSNMEALALQAEMLTKQSIDVRECRCLDILLSVYPQLVRHWKNAGNMEKTFTFLMESASAAVAVDDNSQAISYLKESQLIMTACKKRQNPFEGEISFVEIFQFDIWDEVRLESLMGQALYHMGQIAESLPHFYKALSILGIVQPSRTIRILFAIFSEGFVQWQHHKNPNRYFGTCGPIQAPRLIEQARCLSHVFHDYIQSSNQNLRALLAVLQQVNKAEEVGNDTQELLIAYTCMMEVCQTFHWSRLGVLYESKAQGLCNAYQESSVEVYTSMVHLYATSMNMRLSWGRIADAIDSGYMAVRLAAKVHDTDVRLQILPILSQALMLHNQLNNAVDILNELEYTDNETEAVVGKTLYCACCLDLLLEFGLQLERYQKISKFAHIVKKNEAFRSDHVPMNYMACCLRLWCQRRQIYDEASGWENVAKQWQPKRTNQSFLYVKSLLKALECSLLELSHAYQQRNAHRVNELLSIVKKSLKDVNRMASKMPIWKPRILHYEAYFQAIRSNMNSAQRMLTKCIKMSEKLGNQLEANWAMHHIDMWYDPDFDRKQDQFWMMRSHNARALDHHVIKHQETSLIFFTLPLPRWFD